MMKETCIFWGPQDKGQNQRLEDEAREIKKIQRIVGQEAGELGDIQTRASEDEERHFMALKIRRPKKQWVIWSIVL